MDILPTTRARTQPDPPEPAEPDVGDLLNIILPALEAAGWRIVPGTIDGSGVAVARAGWDFRLDIDRFEPPRPGRKIPCLTPEERRWTDELAPFSRNAMPDRTTVSALQDFGRRLECYDQARRDQ